MPPTTTATTTTTTTATTTATTTHLAVLARHRDMHMEEHILVVTVVMLKLIAANSKLGKLVMLMITINAAGMIVVAATAINTWIIRISI